MDCCVYNFSTHPAPKKAGLVKIYRAKKGSFSPCHHPSPAPLQTPQISLHTSSSSGPKMSQIYSHLLLQSIKSAALPLKRRLAITLQAPAGLPVTSKPTVCLKNKKLFQEQTTPMSTDAQPGHRQMLVTSSREKGQTQKSPKFPDLDETSLIVDENGITINTLK